MEHDSDTDSDSDYARFQPTSTTSIPPASTSSISTTKIKPSFTYQPITTYNSDTARLSPSNIISRSRRSVTFQPSIEHSDDDEFLIADDSSTTSELPSCIHLISSHLLK